MTTHGKIEGAISIRKVTKIYDPEGARVMAMKDCSFEMGAGEFTIIVGPSGCGKTTLLNAVAGFDTITSGEILLDGDTLSSSLKQIKPNVDRMVVFQNGALFPWKTVLENIIYGPVVQGRMKRPAAVGHARGMLHQVGLGEIEDKYPEELSSGVQRRVEILRALINQPKVIMLDEPFRGLDAVAKTVMHEFLMEVFCASPRTMFFITHDLDEAIFLGHKVVIMTTRPAQVKKIVSVDLPWPREHHIMNSREYLKLKQEVLEAVHEEAKKAFEAGERELA
ncbi:MAG: ABC transporter ATP-binding protein [Alphaproteobacteria bacterium]|uniref:ABC transporter ATP-binding protein n=1 Tax=Candidatus Nitrobium versatile TaxID=2884831 RepID=A0A953LZ09_9BACT|nr:ABC transporter ATP-binding protein [Candidatus Nitrobium versatile]